MPRRQRLSCVAWTLAGLLAAIIVELTGPQMPVSFCVRLPLIVLASGATWCAARWRRRVTVTAEEVIVRTLLRTRRIPRARAMCSTALGTGMFIARAQRLAPRPASMVTPWLVLTSTLGVALVTVKILTVDPRLSGALLAGGAAVSIAALGATLLPEAGGVSRRRSERHRAST